MKKMVPILKKGILFLVFWATCNLWGQAQDKPIALRWDNQGRSIKGDFVQIGNLRKSGGTMIHVADPSHANKPTMNSSAATLQIASPSACLKVKWAGLYWVAPNRTANGNNPSIRKVKIKLPTQDYYHDLEADEHMHSNFAGIEDAYNCFKDVTSLIQSIGTSFNNGEYIVGDIYSDEFDAGWGGWTLIVVYEDVTVASAKRIYIYDGSEWNFFNYSGIQNKNINITGFQTPPAPASITARIGVLTGAGNIYSFDQLKINGHLQGQSVAPNKKDDFMDASISLNHSLTAMPRRPVTPIGSTFVDLDIFDVPNATQVIGNGATSLQIQFSAADAYITYVVPFSVQVIEPEIQMEKKAFKGSQDVTGGSVNLGDILRYEVSFKNTGTDDAKNLTISDFIPVNLDVSTMMATINVPAGVTYTYNQSTRELKFSIPDDLVKKNSATHKITFEVQVPAHCNGLVDACSNRISNITQAKYWGHINSPVTPFTAISTNAFPTCSGLLEGPSTFIADLGTCVAKSTKVLCNPTLELVAGADFDTYSWTKDGQSGVLGTTRKLVVSSPGVYRVFKTKAGCADMTEEITVVPHITANPINPFASEVLRCNNDGRDYPQIYLCGTTATKQINLSISGASYKWEKRNNCGVPPNYSHTNCPVYDQFGCTWSQVATGANFTASQPGDYRVTIQESGCVSVFYFAVTKTDLSPSVNPRDIICTTPGRIQINNVPNGYQYELRKNDGLSIVKPKQNSNVFTISSAEFDAHGVGGSYRVFIYGASTHTQTRDCVFKVPASIRKRTPSITVTPTPMACANTKGSLRVQVADAYPQYTYEIRKDNATGAVVVPAQVTNQPDMTFNGLNDGFYYVKVTTDDGCELTETKQITKLPELKATATVKRHLMCPSEPAIVRVDVQGGTKDLIYGYSYRLNGATSTFQDNGAGFFEFPVTNVGTHTIEVIDANNCSVLVTSPAVRQLAQPVFDISTEYMDCGAKVKVVINLLSNPENYTFRYRIRDLGGQVWGWQTGNEFHGIPAGTALVANEVEYAFGTETCTLALNDIPVPPPTSGAVYASAGVSHLIGCGSGANADKGKIRITNVRNGVPPYEFSFDDGATWSLTEKERWVVAGTHKIKVRDKIGCEWATDVVMPPIGTEPQLSVGAVTYACDGNGSVVVTNNKPTYAYTYQLDGGTETTSATFRNLTPGTHTITIKYADTTAPTPSILIRDDFGVGDPLTSMPGMTPLYTCIDPRTQVLTWNQYFVAGTKDITHTRQGWWLNDATFPNDHTDPANPASRYLAIDFGQLISNGAIFYERDVNDVIPNRPIQFEMFGYNLVKSMNCTRPVMIMEVVALHPDGSVVQEAGQDKVLGRIQSKEIPVNNGNANAWFRFASDGTGVDTAVTPLAQVNPGSYTNLKIRVRTKYNTTGCNDFAFDDIYVFQNPEVCGATKTLTLTIEPDKAFGVVENQIVKKDVKCNGDNSGSYSVKLKNTDASGYWVSKDNGVSWTQHIANPFIWNGLTAGNHTLKLRYGQNTTDCEVVKNFTISQPSALVLQPIADQILGCQPANVNFTAQASGGTGALTYELTPPSGAIITQSSPNFVLTLVGAYSIKVTDINGCSKQQNFNVVQGVPPTINVSASSKYCVNTGNDAQIHVTISGGVSPYTYTINGVNKLINTTRTSHNFTDLEVGTHTIVITDSKGCAATLVETISPKLNIADAVVEKDITCDMAPNNKGKIKVTITGGYTPYIYSAKRNGVAVPASQNVSVVGNEFIYEDGVQGAYTFEITDSKGCKVSVARTLTTPVAPTLTHTKEDVKCKGGNSGKITIAVSGGLLPYTYFLDGVNKGTQNEFTGLAVGNYTIKVVDAKKCEASVSVRIDEPLSSITAFAGVSDLVGCGTGVNKDKAKVRITNVAGGVPGYEYSFDNRANWSTTNEGWVSPGTSQMVYVRDANKCELALSVDVPQRITPPTFVQSAITYACDGKGAVTITPSVASYTYEYSTDGTTFTTTNTFTGLTPGTHNITIRYKDANPPSLSVLAREDFGVGSDVCSPNVSSSLFCARNSGPGAGRYVIGNTGSTFLNLNLGNWTKLNDHTNPTNPLSRMLLVDIGNVSSGDVIYKKEVQIEANRPIKYQMFLFNLTKVGRPGAEPNVEIRLVNPLTNAVIDSQESGGISNSSHPNDWREFSGTLNPGNVTTISIQVVAKSWHSTGSDMAIDDIYVYQQPQSCPITATQTIEIEPNKEFKLGTIVVDDAKCNGATGTITINVENFNPTTGYRYKVDNGVWQDTNVSPLVVPNLLAGTHTITLEYKKGSGVYDCSLSFSRKIEQPNALGLVPTITIPAMCSNANRATLQLQVSGGVPPYQYRMDGGAWQGSNLFSNVSAGNHLFSVKDGNGCEFTIGAPLNVPQPKNVDFSVTPIACYSGNNDGQIVVNVTDGNGNYQFSINNGAWQTPLIGTPLSYTFTNLHSGTHIIKVKDAFGCEKTISNVVIHPKLEVVVKATDVNCNPGKIEVSATGGAGVGSYTYAFMPAGTAPNASDYGTINSKSVASPATYDVYVKSADCVVRKNVAIGTAPAVGFDVQAENPTCYSQKGKIKIANIVGDKTYKLWYADATTPSVPIETITGFINNAYTFIADEGSYVVFVEDRYGCKEQKPVAIVAKKELKGTIRTNPTAGCTQLNQPVPLQLVIDPALLTSYAGYDIHYSPDNGQTWNATPITNAITDLAQGTIPFAPGRSFTLLLKTVPTGAGAGASPVCLVALPVHSVAYPLRELSITTDLTPATCASTSPGDGFKVEVTVTEGVAPYMFTYDDPNAGNWLPATHSSPGSAHLNRRTFEDLIPGRTYNFYVRDNAGCILQNRKDIYEGYDFPVIITPIVRPICHGAAVNTGGINFVIRNVARTPGTNFTPRLYKKTNTNVGILVQILPTTAMPAVGAEVTIASTIGLDLDETYYLEIEEFGTNCLWGSPDATIYQGQELNATPRRMRDITCTQKGVIAVENPTGGGGYYTFRLTSTGFVTSVNSSSPIIEIDKTNVNTTGTITVQVEMESLGCTKPLGSVDIYVAKDPVLHTITPKSCSLPLSIEIVPATGENPAVPAPLANYEYTIDNGATWVDNQGVFENIPAGSAYRVGVKDKATGCFVINPVTTTLHPKMVAEVKQTQLLGCGVQAKIEIKITDGSGNYAYEISGTTIAPRVNITPLVPLPAPTIEDFTTNTDGTYVVTLYDNNNPTCSGLTYTITIAKEIKPQFSVSVVSPTCNGGNDGQIFINEVDMGTGPYTYTIAHPSVTPLPTWNAVTKSFENVKASGAIPYTIVSTANPQNGCTTSTTILVGEPTPVQIMAGIESVTQFACSAGSNTPNVAIVELDPTRVQGGTPPYAFKMVYDNGTPTNPADDIEQIGTRMIITNHQGGNVSIFANDASGCVNPVSYRITINPYEEIVSLPITINAPIPCGGNEVIMINPQSGAVPFSPNVLRYIKSDNVPDITDPAWQTSNTFNLPIGTHTFWVWHTQTGCMKSVVHQVKNPNTFVINPPVILQPKCKGDNVQSVTFEVFDPTYAGTYNWSVQSGTTTPLLSSVNVPLGTQTATISFVGTLKAGTYTLVVTQAGHPSCDQEYPFEITEPSHSLTASVVTKPITCALNDGVIEVTNAQGGWGDYEYRITPSATGIPTAWTIVPTFENLVADTYHVEIKDKGGCEVSVSSTLTLANPVPLTATLTIRQQNCIAGIGQLEVTASGGQQSNYTFQLVKDGVDYRAPQTIPVGNSLLFNALPAGQYAVKVSDNWGCSVIVSATTSSTLFEPITAVSVSVDKVVTCSLPQGADITISHLGGSNTITYTIESAGYPATSQPNKVFTNLPAGTYTLTIYDVTTGCASVTHSFELADVIAPTFTATPVSQVKCNGGSDGEFQVTIPDTNTHTDYRIDVTSSVVGFVPRSEVVSVVPSTTLFSGLKAGVYNVVVTSARGCVHTDTVTITEPNVLVVSSTSTLTTQFACNAGNEPQQAVLTIVPQGGTAPYRFSIDGTDYSNTSGTFSITHTGVVQTITAYIIDANGCTADNSTTPIVINPLPRITNVSVNKVQGLNCLNNAETINVSVVGGSGLGFNIEVMSNDTSVPLPPAQMVSSVATFMLSTPAQYRIKVTDVGTGCYEIVPHQVSLINEMSIKVAEKQSVTCFGDTNGKISLTTENYNGVYQYRVLDAQTLTDLPTPITATVTVLVASSPKTIEIDNVPAGQYVISVRELNMPFCTLTSTLVSVGGPSQGLTYTLTLTSPLTCQDNDASLSIEARGGWGDYQYRLLRNGVPHSVYGTYTQTSIYQGLTQGSYQVMIKDRKGCEITTTTTNIHSPTPISLVTNPLPGTETKLDCYADKTANISVVSVTGGSGNYRYVLVTRKGTEIIESGAQTETTFSGLGDGVYAIKVIDGWGCDVTSGDITIKQPDLIKVTAVVSRNLTCNSLAEIIVSATGGTAPYEYSDSPTGTFATNNVFSVGAGTYTYYVKDAKGCISEVSNSVEILPVPPLTLTPDVSSAVVKCNGESSAVIRVNAQGGLGNYQYELYKSGVLQLVTPTIVGQTASFESLNAGTYYVKVISGDCEERTSDINISESPALIAGVATSTNETCYGRADGTINVEVTGGTGAISYAISPRLDRIVTAEHIRTKSFAPGQYLIVARDENGCYLELPFTIEAATQLVATVTAHTNETCFGYADGSVSITISGGKAPYQTSYVSDSHSTPFVEGKTFYDQLPVSGGAGTIIIKDKNGCQIYLTVPQIQQGIDLQAKAVAVSECAGSVIANRIEISVNPAYASQVRYALDGGTPQISPLFAGVSTGTHTITISHIGGCVTNVVVDVAHYDTLSVVSSTSTEITCNGANDASITFKVTGGSASYTYTISPNEGVFDKENSRYTGLSEGYYMVQVIDNQLKCVVSQGFNFVEPKALSVLASTQTEACHQANDGKVSFTITGGRLPYSYQLKDIQGNVVTATTGATSTPVTITDLAPNTYVLTYVDNGGVCTKTETLVVGASPDIKPTNAVEVKYECATSSITFTTAYIELIFDNSEGKLTQGNTYYALNSTNIVDAKAFAEFAGNRAIIKGLPDGQNQYITIFYKGCSYTIPSSEYFDVQTYKGLTLENISDPRTMNVIKVKAVGGKAPYTYYFNGNESLNADEYHLERTDPGYKTADGRNIKQIRVKVVDNLNPGCQAEMLIEKELIDIIIPNNFTPNDDGNNDRWQPQNTRLYPNMTTAIYDRYGRLLKTLNKNESWDGKYNSNPMPTGDYWYVIKLNTDDSDDRQFMGHFTLLR